MAKFIRSNIYLLTAALSFLFSYLIIIFGSFPSFGLSLSLIIFALFTYNYVLKGPDTKLFLSFGLIFSTLLFIRSEPSITFFNFWAAIFFGVFMLTSHKRPTGFIGYLMLSISLFFNSLFTQSKYYFDNKNKYLKNLKIGELVSGLLISFIVLAVILPLLASSNPIFETALQSILNIFNLENIIQYIIRIIFFLICLYFIPKILTIIEKETNYSFSQVIKPEPINILLPKIITSFVLILFFITQFQLYFASELNYSQTTREVFGQLSIVAVIVFVLIYNSDLKTKLSKNLNLFLGVEGVFLALMAYKSVFEYIAVHGLTYLRLYGIVFATLITGVFILYKISLHKNGNFARQVIIFFSLMLILVNLANFDYLIYHFNAPRVNSEVDYGYLSTLSADSLSYEEQYQHLYNYSFDENFNSSYKNENPLILLYHIENLQNKYANFDIREFTILDYLQYLKIKDINTGKLREYYEHNPVPTSM